MDIEQAYLAAKTLQADMPEHVTYNQFIRTAEFKHPGDLELNIPADDIIKINCEEFYLNGGNFGNPSIIQFDALGFEQDMIEASLEQTEAYYHTILNWPNIREQFLKTYNPTVYWLHMWQSTWINDIGNRKPYSFDELEWLASTSMTAGRKLLALACGLTTPEQYQPLTEAPDMYLMTLMSVPEQGKYHYYKHDWQPEHGPFMLLKDSGLRDIVMHKLINEGKVAVTQTM